MRKLIFIFFIVVVNLKSYCQDYVPMPMQNCYWQMYDSKNCPAHDLIVSSSSSFVYKIYPYNDTVIMTKHYVKFYSEIITNTVSPICGLSSSPLNIGYWGAVRQDTSGGKIFMVSPNQTSESMLYNFNYIKGDSVKTTLGQPPHPPGYDQYRIVDSVFYQSYSDGICRKTFRLKPYVLSIGSSLTYHRYITEGIGNEAGFSEQKLAILDGGLNTTYESWGSFLSINNSVISAIVTNTCAQYVGLKNNFNKSQIKIYPNPTNNEITISIENSNSQNYYTLIYNMLGVEILRSNNKTLKVNDLPSGSYYIKCFNSETKK